MRPNVSIPRVLAATVCAQVVLVAAAFLWVALWSHVLHPGGTPEQYAAYAQRASPFVSLVVGVPVFFLLARRLARRGAAGVRDAVAAVSLYLAIDLAIVLLVADETLLGLALFAPNALAKALAVRWGVRGAAPAAA